MATPVPTTPPAAGSYPTTIPAASYAGLSFASLGTNYTPTATMPASKVTATTAVAKPFLSGGVLIGIIAGGAALIIIIMGVLLWWWLKRRRQRKVAWNTLNESMASSRVHLDPKGRKPSRDESIPSDSGGQEKSRGGGNGWILNDQTNSAVGSPASSPMRFGGGRNNNQAEALEKAKAAAAASRSELFGTKPPQLYSPPVRNASSQQRPDQDFNNISFNSPVATPPTSTANYPPSATKDVVSSIVRRPPPIFQQFTDHSNGGSDFRGRSTTPSPELTRHPPLPRPPSPLSSPSPPSPPSSTEKPTNGSPLTLDERFAGVMARPKRKSTRNSSPAKNLLREKSMMIASRDRGKTDTISDFADAYGGDAPSEPHTYRQHRHPYSPEPESDYTPTKYSDSSFNTPTVSPDHTSIYQSTESSPPQRRRQPDQRYQRHQQDLHRVDSRPLNELEEILESFQRGPNGERIPTGSMSSRSPSTSSHVSRSTIVPSPSLNRSRHRTEEGSRSNRSGQIYADHNVPTSSSVAPAAISRPAPASSSLPRHKSNRHVRGDSLHYTHQPRAPATFTESLPPSSTSYQSESRYATSPITLQDQSTPIEQHSATRAKVTTDSFYGGILGLY